MSCIDVDVIVVGSGVAALSTALAAAPRRVALITRGEPGRDGASCWAQGGIAAAFGPADSAALHARDTLAAGAFHNVSEVVDRLAGQACAAVDWLAGLGVKFDRDGDAYRLGHEAAHSHRRIVHASGDASGAEIVRGLHAAVQQATHVQVYAQRRATALAQDGNGVVGVHTQSETGAMSLRAEATVLATGGIGALYRYTTNPASADGSGLAMALDIGAALSDMEFVQFHPTALAPRIGHSGQLSLLTEALRGAGAVLVDENGRRFMPAYSEAAELATRDVVARAVWLEMQAGRRVYLDCRNAPGAAFVEQFPTVYASCMARGLDPLREPIPVVPAQHYHMGGIRVDACGASTIPGLYAVGEVACTGVHGANRLASNSLLEGVVFGRALGTHLAESDRGDAPRKTLATRSVPVEVPVDVDKRIRDLLWQHAGLVRDADGLCAAHTQLSALIGRTRAWPIAQSRLRVALAVLSAALARSDSVGAHFRSDAALSRSA